jgi:hypothetical protein
MASTGIERDLGLHAQHKLAAERDVPSQQVGDGAYDILEDLMQIGTLAKLVVADGQQHGRCGTQHWVQVDADGHGARAPQTGTHAGELAHEGPERLLLCDLVKGIAVVAQRVEHIAHSLAVARVDGEGLQERL